MEKEEERPSTRCAGNRGILREGRVKYAGCIDGPPIKRPFSSEFGGGGGDGLAVSHGKRTVASGGKRKRPDLSRRDPIVSQRGGDFGGKRKVTVLKRDIAKKVSKGKGNKNDIVLNRMPGTSW